MNSNKYSPQIRYVASAGSLPNRNGANWTSPLTLTGFLEPGAHLIRYLVDPGSRNHGSELPYDGGDLNAYKFFKGDGGPDGGPYECSRQFLKDVQ